MSVIPNYFFTYTGLSICTLVYIKVSKMPSKLICITVLEYLKEHHI